MRRKDIHDLLEWLDERVGEGRGFVALSLTEDGGVGCWLPEDGSPNDADSRRVPEGNDAVEALMLRMEAHKAAKPKPRKRRAAHK